LLEQLGEKKQIIVVLENIHGHGLHLTRYLDQAGFFVRYMPLVYTEKARKRIIHQDKNDYLNAKRVGKVILCGEETLPA